MIEKLVRLFLALVVLRRLASALAQSASYPSRPIRLVVPYPAGGLADLLARIVAEKLTARWASRS